MAGVVGVSEGKGIGLSARTLDDTAFGQPRSRAWTGGGACVLRQAGPGHGLQDPRPGGRQAAQSALLPGTPRSRLCGKDGRSVVRLSGIAWLLARCGRGLLQKFDLAAITWNLSKVILALSRLSVTPLMKAG